jgi:hypothetical protein
MFADVFRARRSRHDRGRRSLKLRLEPLEQRWLLSTFLVTNTNDAGPGSLRQAILDSNLTPGHNTIDFDIPGAGVQTIRVGSTTGMPLPDVTNPVTIDAYSQPGTRVNSLARGDNAVLLVQLDGSTLPFGDGLHVIVNDVTVQGLVVDRFPNTGIHVGGAAATGDAIAGNFVGTDPTGTFAEGNDWNGIRVDNSASGNTVGGTTPAARNVNSGNGNNGVSISGAGSGNVVEGNFLGTGATGTAAVANAWDGVTIYASSGNLIGGTTPGAGNLCSGNSQRGVDLFGDATTGNVVEGNFIGTDVTGSFAIGNHWEGVAANGIGFNVIGGTSPGAGNVISGNYLGGVGIWIAGSTGNLVEGNFIGTDATGSFAVGNQGDGVGPLTGRNTVGGTTPGARNVISGNGGDGVGMWSPGTSGNLVEGNFIGTDVTGAFAVANQGNGVSIEWSATGNMIGGTTAGARNVISGNAANGVTIWAPSTAGNVVAGNFIGLGAAGNALGNADDGVRIDFEASGNTIGGTTPGAGNVISRNGSKGVELTGADSGNTVAGNLIGTDPTGTVAVGNLAGGVSINGQASANTVGGTTAAARNVISGNDDHGVEIFDAGTSGNVVAGNFLGTDVTGTAALGNTLDGVGIFDDGTDNTVGGTDAGAGNVISANGADGVEIHGSGTTDNLIAGNLIGTDATGTVALGNTLDGVGIHDGASDNRVGAYGPSARNVISGNQRDGVNLHDSGTTDNVIEDDYIGVNPAGTAALGNGRDGVSIGGGASGNTIGTAIPEGRDVISGNGGDGVVLLDAGTSSNAVAGSYIGTDAAGTAALGNGGHGVSIRDGADANVIGGGSPGVGNVISGNGQDGIAISAASGNGVGANYIGTGAGGIAALGNSSYGVEIYGGASNNLIGGEDPTNRNVISGNVSDGVNIHDEGTDGNAVANNFIGINAGGTAAVANRHDGVDLSGGASTNQIGGNVISGNAADGLDILDSESTGNVIVQNEVGTNAAGTAALGNAYDGVKIRDGAGANVIGGTDPGVGNLISGNGLDGVSLNETGPGNWIEGNLIGTDKTGTAALGNVEDGVDIQYGGGNHIGGTAPGAGNVIAHNGHNGVEVSASLDNDIQGNSLLANGEDGVFIQFGGSNLVGGTTPGAGNVIASNGRNEVEVNASSNNGIHQNSIFANGALGISLTNGGNDNAVAPILTSAVSSPSGTTIQGTLDAAPDTTYTLEFFSNPGPAPNGQVYLASLTATTDDSGHAEFTAIVAMEVAVGDFITATATDPLENTSAFSAWQVVTESDSTSVARPQVIHNDRDRGTGATDCLFSGPGPAEPARAAVASSNVVRTVDDAFIGWVPVPMGASAPGDSTLLLDPRFGLV